MSKTLLCCTMWFNSSGRTNRLAAVFYLWELYLLVAVCEGITGNKHPFDQLLMNLPIDFQIMQKDLNNSFHAPADVSSLSPLLAVHSIYTGWKHLKLHQLLTSEEGKKNHWSFNSTEILRNAFIRNILGKPTNFSRNVHPSNQYGGLQCHSCQCKKGSGRLISTGVGSGEKGQQSYLLCMASLPVGDPPFGTSSSTSNNPATLH